MNWVAMDHNEAERLQALRAYEILDTPPEEQFDRLVDLTAEILEAPLCMISLVDEDRQWFKAVRGIDARETSREVSFCAHAILQTDVFVVPDARADARFCDNPLVTGHPNIRTYCAALLATAEGHRIGTLCVVYTEVRPFSDADRLKLQQLARLVVDALEARQAFRTVDAANRAKIRFLSIISHEVRTPLNAVMALSECLALSHANDGIREQTALIHQGASKLLEVFSSVFDFADGGGVKTRQPSPILLKDCLERVRHRALGAAARKGLGIRVITDPALNAPILEDLRMLEKAIDLLVDNAIKFTEVGGVSIRALALPGGERYRLEVCDTGPGISDAYAERLFAPFSQVDMSSTRMHGGVGLGLAICRELVEAMHGEIRLAPFDPEAAGGSTFWIELPRSPAQAPH